MKRKTGILIIACIGIFFITCSNLTNPFLNKDDSKAEIVNKSFNDFDTVNIFSAETISIRIYLKEHIDSFKLHVDNNRFWNSTDSIVTYQNFQQQHHFAFSFYDTGWQNIRLISYINNGDTVLDSLCLYAVSPLKQNNISGLVGDSVVLSTKPVKDQVLYVWDFRNGIIIKETTPSTKKKISTAFTSPFGELYVEDLSNHRSPAVLFPITTQTQSELRVSCVNDSVKADSVYSKYANLKFSIEVSGAQQLRSARINGKPFDDSLKNGESFILNYYLQNLDTINKPVELQVLVTDEIGRSVKKNFFVHFLKIVPQINVAYPVEDSMQTAASSINVLGNVTNINQHDSLYLFIRNNGRVQSKMIITWEKPVFSFEIPLPGFSNHIAIELYPDSLTNGYRLALSHFYVFYNPFHVDTIPPQIRIIRCNGEPVNNFFMSRTDSMKLEIDAVDNSNKLTVSVNGDTIRKELNELFYSKEVIIPHGKDTTIIVVTATDSIGYHVNDTVHVQCNKLPQWKKIPEYSVITAGEVKDFEISTEDVDGDSLFITMTIKRHSGDTVLNASSGHASWYPRNIDIGEYVAKLTAWDGFEYVDTSFTIVVKGTGAIPVKLSTDTSDFPRILFVGDNLHVGIQEIPLTGTRPFSYAAFFVKSKKTILNGTDSVLHWMPTISDIGEDTLRIMIKDGLNYKDSIAVPIQIMKKVLAYIRWERSSLQFTESGPVGGFPRIFLSSELKFPVKIPYTITFPDNSVAAKASDIRSSISGFFNFKENDTAASIMLSIADDTIPEPVEKFEIWIDESDSIKFNEAQGPKIFTGEIIDNDRVYFSFEITDDEGLEESKDLSATVKLSKPLERSLELLYEVDTAGSSAQIGEDFDYINSIHKVFFDSGKTEAQIQMNIVDDNKQEDNETIILKLRSEDNFVRARDSVFVYNILNDDTTAHYSFLLDEQSGSESDTQLRIRVNLDRKIDSAVDVKFSVDGNPLKTTADLGTDFRILNSTYILTFNAGETSKEIIIGIEDDTIPEKNETFTINLESSSSMVLPGLHRSFQYTIVSNEVSVNINGNSSTVDEWTRNIIPITIQLSAPLKEDLTVYFRTDTNSTADSGKDYNVAEPNYVIFRAGETAKDMHYTVLEDNLFEGPEKVTFRIFGVSNKKVAYIGESSWCDVTINDNDIGWGGW